MGRDRSRLRELFGCCAIAVSLSMFVSVFAFAQSPATELQVGVFPVAPFVMEQNGALTGFSIELWNNIATRLNVKSRYHVVNDVAALTDDLRAKRVDLVASPVFITSARDAEFDFSHTIMDAGLGILVRGTGDAARRTSPLHDLLQIFLSPTIFVWLGVGLLLILIPAHIIWFLDRRHPIASLRASAIFLEYFTRCFGLPRRSFPKCRAFPASG